MRKKESLSSSEVRDLDTPVFSVDLREGWDVESWSDAFISWARKQTWYRPNLLYSGFDAKTVGKKSSTWEGGIVWASFEQDVLGSDHNNNPLDYAQEYSAPAIAVYDPEKMQERSIRAYIPLDASARIAIVKLILD